MYFLYHLDIFTRSFGLNKLEYRNRVSKLPNIGREDGQDQIDHAGQKRSDPGEDLADIAAAWDHVPRELSSC
jgi:hypothetical protein